MSDLHEPHKKLPDPAIRLIRVEGYQAAAESRDSAEEASQRGAPTQGGRGVAA